MKEPGNNPLPSILVVIILLGLIYALYVMMGGDWLAFTKLTSSGERIVEGITGSMRALGDSLGRTFSSILR